MLRPGLLGLCYVLLLDHFYFILKIIAFSCRSCREKGTVQFITSFYTTAAIVWVVTMLLLWLSLCICLKIWDHFQFEWFLKLLFSNDQRTRLEYDDQNAQPELDTGGVMSCSLTWFCCTLKLRPALQTVLCVYHIVEHSRQSCVCVCVYHSRTHVHLLSCYVTTDQILHDTSTNCMCWYDSYTSALSHIHTPTHTHEMTCNWL